MLKDYEFWFVVGSQFLYGSEVLETVEARAKVMAEKLSAAEQIPCKVVYKVTVKTESECTRVMKEANADNKPADAAQPTQQVGGQTIDVEVKEKTKS